MTGRHAQPMPERIAKYRIDAVLGAGAMGVVYKAFDPMIERAVALKTIRPELLREAEASPDTWRARFAREVKTAARCIHPNVVTIYDFGEDQGAPYIAMEFCLGRALSEFMKASQTFDVQTALYIAGRILAALQAAHGHGIVHRDIKPGNVLLLDDGAVKVTDFGIARLESSSMTQAGVMIGTPSYMAPEQFLGDAVDGRTDVFAVAAVLYEMLAGRRPFEGKSVTEILYKVMNEVPEPPSRRNPAVPPALDRAILGALSREPARRPPTADALAGALADSLGDVEAATVIAPARGPVAPRPEEGFDAETLARIERRLAAHVGPIARVMVARAAPDAPSVEALHERLAEAIGDPEIARAFLRSVPASERTYAGTGSRGTGRGDSLTGARTGGRTGGHTGGRTGARPDSRADSRTGRGVVLDQDTLNRTQRSLASHLGPIAQVVIRRAAAEADDLDTFYRMLAEQIPTERERDEFLRRHTRSRG